MSTIAQSGPPAKVSLLYDPKVRGLVYQVVLVGIVGFVLYAAASNAIDNLRAAKVASGFAYLNANSGFDVNQTLVPYGATSTYGRAFVVGLLNTLLVAVVGCILATFLGFSIGVARLSNNWIVAKLATVYVEVIRNIPLLLQLLFWYIAVLRPLPDARNSLRIGAGFFLNNRGLYVPKPLPNDEAWVVLVAFAVGLVAAIGIGIWAHRRQTKTGQQFPVGWTGLALIVGLPAVVWPASSAATRSRSTSRNSNASTCAAVSRSSRNSWR